MRYETVGPLQLPKIGLGTWGIGGDSSADPSRDQQSLAALRSAIDLGYRHFDTAEMYAAGHCEELVGRAIHESKIPRESFFITSKVMPENLGRADLLRAADRSLRRLGLDYVDLYLVHWPNLGVDLKDSFRALDELARAGKVRNIGVSNFDLGLLRKACELSQTPILTDQVPYSLGNRSYAENGVLEYCQRNNVLLMAYTPLAPAAGRIGAALNEIAASREATPQQIALAWLVGQNRVVTIPMSADPAHQKANLAACELVLSAEEMERLG